MVYLNNAHTTVHKPEGVKEAEPKTAAEARAKTAGFFNLKKADNVIFTSDELQAMDIAIRSLVQPGDHVITTVMEQDGVLGILCDMETQGAEVSVVGVNPYGRLLYEDIEKEIKPNTRFLVICHGSNVTGNINDMEVIGNIARRHKLMIICDGSQVAGAAEVNLDALGIDVYCFTAHKKIMGPYGIGGICLKDGVSLDSRLTDSIGELDEKLYGGLCAALDFIREKGIYGISIFPHRLAKRFFESVQSMDRITVYGDFGTGVRIPNIAVKVEGFTPEEVAAHMKKNGIAVKAGTLDAEQLVSALGVPDGLTRFSFGYFNTRRDVNDAVWVMMDLLGIDDLYLLS